MEITPDVVKQWLAKHEDRDRYWLAEQCETEKRTVDNWLSSPRGLPSKAALIIERLMRVDEAAEEAAEEERKRRESPELERFSVEVTSEEYDRINAAAMAQELLIREWA